MSSPILRGNALSRHDVHPLRAWMLWPDYVASMSRIGQAMRGMATSDDLNLVGEVVQRKYNEMVQRFPFEQRPSGQMQFFQLVERGFRIASLASCGMNIYTIDPKLRNALGRSKLGDVRLGDLHAPYQAFYLGFEQGSGIYFGTKDDPKRWLVDGAYILVTEPEQKNSEYIWNICVTCRSRISMLLPESWPLQEEPHFTFDLKGKSDATFEDALGEAIESGGLDLEADQEVIADFKEAIASFQDGAERHGMQLTSPKITSREHLAKFKSENIIAAKQALALVLGAVCAITSKPDLKDKDPEWPDGTPMDLVRSIQDGKTPKARKRASGEIKRRGFTPVRRIDLSSFGVRQQESDLPSGKTVRPHWRSGHFRRQPHGKNNSLVTLKWIMPTIVNAGKGDVATSRLYRVHDSGQKES